MGNESKTFYRDDQTRRSPITWANPHELIFTIIYHFTMYVIMVHMQERRRLYTEILADHLRRHRQIALVSGPRQGSWCDPITWSRG